MLSSKVPVTVPAGIAKPRFIITGAGDEIGGRGGVIVARLPAEAGQTFDLKMGGDGAASSVSRGGVPLLVARGGDGVEPNYIEPEAELLAEKAPGMPVAEVVGDGSVLIEWHDAREPFELVDSRGHVIVDIFYGEKAAFVHTGSTQEWIVPQGVDQAIFELFGGEGESGEPRGHTLTDLDVSPGETFHLFVGGMVGPRNGHAIVHYWPAEDSPKILPDDQSSAGRQTEHESTSIDPSQKPVSVCIVPRLRGRTVRAARRALVRANCTLTTVNHTPVRKRMRGRIVDQNRRAGTVVTAGSGVTVTVGAP